MRNASVALKDQARAQNLVIFMEREKQQKQPAMSDAVAQLMTVFTGLQMQTPPSPKQMQLPPDVAACLTATASRPASTTDCRAAVDQRDGHGHAGSRNKPKRCDAGQQIRSAGVGVQGTNGRRQGDLAALAWNFATFCGVASFIVLYLPIRALLGHEMSQLLICAESSTGCCSLCWGLALSCATSGRH